eukprot:6487840-Prymnesium_polylepis.1
MRSLLAQMEHPMSEVRHAALAISEKLVPHLRRQLADAAASRLHKDGEGHIRAAAAKLIGSLGREVVQQFQKVLKQKAENDTNGQVKRSCQLALKSLTVEDMDETEALERDAPQVSR